MRVTVGGTQVAQWTMTTSMTNRSVNTTLTGGVNVEFTNDASGRDIQVDYVVVNGITRQAEQQSNNTAVYQNGKCGGSNSEWMHCNGYIGFQGKDAVSENTISANTAEINVYPNPNNGLFTIDLNGFEGMSSITVFDLNGRVVSERMVIDQRFNNFEVLEKGMYIVKVSNKDNIITRRVNVN